MKEATLIYETVHWSRAYGLGRTGSDEDLKGILVGPASWYHGFLGRPRAGRALGRPRPECANLQLHWPASFQRRGVFMECVIFIGVQACGKTSLFKERFFRTHVRVSLDMLKTRHRERRFVETCIETRQPFVVDNTNPRKTDRQRYIEPSRKSGFRIVGYYFQSQLVPALERNATRLAEERVPDKGVRGTHARLELPSRSEGFDELYFVSLRDGGGFTVEEWLDEL